MTSTLYRSTASIIHRSTPSYPWLPCAITKDNVLFYSSLGDCSTHGDRTELHDPAFIKKGFLDGDIPHESGEWDLNLLRIILLELCLDQPARQKCPNIFGEEKHMFDLIIAMTWAKGVRDEGGPDYAAAVQWCFSGGGKYSN